MGKSWLPCISKYQSNQECEAFVLSELFYKRQTTNPANEKELTSPIIIIIIKWESIPEKYTKYTKSVTEAGNSVMFNMHMYYAS